MDLVRGGRVGIGVAKCLPPPAERHMIYLARHRHAAA